MDYKDFVVVAVAALFGMAGATVGGFPGVAVGIVVGAGMAATWAAATDRANYLERRVGELESEER
ncbi:MULTISPECIES: hypothetical protein [Halorussus]|uniref:hypothetical protein n=1 Tax=Halorussus TaxID=1070314 RepID=UPI00209F5C78|nr:hypothetical protein [Halorussus vallis]USZ74530.1 hypothetical protein NGM07_13885 [Halorussus vallis]